MKKKKTTRMTIRQIVREEVAMAIELKQPIQPTKPVKKKSYSKNSVLNDVLNETANGEDWETMGGSKFTSERMNELVGGQYNDMMKNSPQQNANPNDPMSEFLNKDYRDVLKKTDEKQKQKYGK